MIRAKFIQAYKDARNDVERKEVIVDYSVRYNINIERLRLILVLSDVSRL